MQPGHCLWSSNEEDIDAKQRFCIEANHFTVSIGMVKMMVLLDVLSSNSKPKLHAAKSDATIVADPKSDSLTEPKDHIITNKQRHLAGDSDEMVHQNS
jgi:hypothetical protein